MTSPDDRVFGSDITGEAPEPDVAEQRIPVTDDDEGIDPSRVRVSTDFDADEADLIEQSIAVPLSDDDLEFDR
jgi:hypothetical protein